MTEFLVWTLISAILGVIFFIFLAVIGPLAENFWRKARGIKSGDDMLADLSVLSPRKTTNGHPINEHTGTACNPLEIIG